jgi:hypothetical protein
VKFSIDDGRAVLERTPETLRALLSGLSAGWLSGNEGPGTWSPHQVVGHLTYIEEVDWIDRTKVILEHGTDRMFEPGDANLLELGELVRPEHLARRGVHPTFGEVTLGQLLATWVVHDLNHLGQIVKAEAKQYRDAVGPWREFLPIVEAP